MKPLFLLSATLLLAGAASAQTVERVYILDCGQGRAQDTSRWTPGHTAGHSRPPSTTDASTLVAVQGVGGVPFQPPVRS